MSKKLIEFRKGELEIRPFSRHIEGGTASINDEITHYEYYDLEDLKNLKTIIKMAIKRQRFKK